MDGAWQRREIAAGVVDGAWQRGEIIAERVRCCGVLGDSNWKNFQVGYPVDIPTE